VANVVNLKTVVPVIRYSPATECSPDEGIAVIRECGSHLGIYSSFDCPNAFKKNKYKSCNIRKLIPDISIVVMLEVGKRNYQLILNKNGLKTKTKRLVNGMN